MPIVEQIRSKAISTNNTTFFDFSVCLTVLNRIEDLKQKELEENEKMLLFNKGLRMLAITFVAILLSLLILSQSNGKQTFFRTNF